MYIRNNSVPFGSWFISKIRYWSNHSNNQVVVQVVGTRVSSRIAVVWGKFTVGYFRVKIVHGKIFSSLGVSDK